MRTSNPVLTAFAKPQTWDDFERQGGGESAPLAAAARPGVMTIGGTINATLVLLAITIVAAVAAWVIVGRNPGLIHPFWIGGALAGLAIGFFLRFSPRAAIAVAPVYAVCEGAFLGAFSFVFARWLGPEIIFQAVVLTFGVLFTLLLGYRAGLIRLGSAAQRMIVVATGGVMFLYLGVFVINMLGFGPIPFVHDLFRIENAGWLGIGFTAFCVVLASLNLVLDFQYIEEGAKAGLPKHMEWYAAFGLLVSLIWLYIEIVRLLAKLRSNN